jgi:hypothetical protein
LGHKVRRYLAIQSSRLDRNARKPCFKRHHQERTAEGAQARRSFHGVTCRMNLLVNATMLI